MFYSLHINIEKNKNYIKSMTFILMKQRRPRCKFWTFSTFFFWAAAVELFEDILLQVFFFKSFVAFVPDCLCEPS